MPIKEGVDDDGSSKDGTKCAQTPNRHLDKKVDPTGTVNTETSKENEAKRQPHDNIIKLITDSIGDGDDDSTEYVKNAQ